MWSILAGIVNGALVGVLGYLKSVKEGKQEKFNNYKFLNTLIIGGVVGFIATQYGVDYSTAEVWLTSSGAILLVEMGIKAIYRWLKKLKVIG